MHRVWVTFDVDGGAPADVRPRRSRWIGARLSSGLPALGLKVARTWRWCRNEIRLSNCGNATRFPGHAYRVIESRSRITYAYAFFGVSGPS